MIYIKSLLVYVLIIFVNVYICYSQTQPAPVKLEDDGTYCLLHKRVPRDPASYNKVYVEKRQQKCKLNLIGGGNPGIFSYRLTSHTNPIPVLDNANAIIALKNLDLGTSPPISALIYAKILGGGETSNTVAGQILGKKLGGTGNEITNIIPMAKETQERYLSFEQGIYDCLKNAKADGASLSWSLLYRSTSESRPFKITYRVFYVNGIDECKNGKSKIFLN